MHLYRLTPRITAISKFPQGFILQVISRQRLSPTPDEVKEALIHVGFTDPEALRMLTSYYWNIEKIS